MSKHLVMSEQLSCLILGTNRQWNLLHSLWVCILLSFFQAHCTVRQRFMGRTRICAGEAPILANIESDFDELLGTEDLDKALQ